MGKLYEILGLAQYEAEKISSSPRDWLHYLDTASQLYRYSFSDTLLIMHSVRGQLPVQSWKFGITK
mgnify:CR=1 FL=1